MRVLPDYNRLRAVALGCWVVAAWWIIYMSKLTTSSIDLPVTLLIFAALFSIGLLAIGIAFWLLGGDRRAGVIFDNKGLLLNLGKSASFVSWDNIEALGVVKRRRFDWISLGSRTQLGIRLREAEPYLQSYEIRLPASEGPLAASLRSIARLLTLGKTKENLPTVNDLERTRTRTGYDILVPETFIGGKADAFINLVQAYRNRVR
jgi:hypothetical protein